MEYIISSTVQHSTGDRNKAYTVKNCCLPVPSRDVTYQTLPGRTGKPLTFLLFTARESFVSDCAAHIGMDGVRIEKEPRQGDEYVYRIS